MIRSALNGDYKKAQQLNHLLLDVHHYLYVEGNPVGIKAAMHVLGFCSSEVRLPLSQMSVDNFKGLQKEMEKVKQGQLVS